jgi:long-chain acyl-CoA synthetase
MLSDAFDTRCARAGGHAAVREGSETLTYAQLLAWSQAISRQLEPVLRIPGQRVAVMLPNSGAFVAAFFAVARAGGVVAPTNPQYGSHDLASHLGDLDAVALLSDPESLGRAAGTLERLPRCPALLEVSREHGARSVRGQTTAGLPLPGPFPAPPLLQQYTSGSTGTPKRVIRTHAHLIAELDCLRATFEVTEEDRFLGVAPFFHVNGLVRTMLTAMHAGATLFPVARFRRREVIDLLTAEQITFCGAVPQIFTILGQTPPRGAADLSALRLVFSSSAPLLPADNRRFSERYGVVIRQLYGSTETGTISFNRDPDPEQHLDSLGRPLDPVRVQVVDERGAALPPGTEGELAIASPFAISSYFGNEVASAESFRGGVYLSGDLGTIDPAGHVRLTGRRKLLINRGGFKVNPYEVEDVIKAHPRVADVAVFGAVGPQGDDVVCCVIVASGACTTDDILAHCRERLADFKIPARIEFRDSLPKSSTGKILRAQLGAPAGAHAERGTP